MNKLLRTLGVISALAALVACGGGGGPGDNSEPLSWQGAQFLEGIADKAEKPAVAVNAAGVGFVVWEQATGGQTEVFARRYRNGVWETAQQVTGDVDADAFDPQVVVLPNGEAIAVWWHETTLGSRVAFKRSVNGFWPDGVTLLSGLVNEVSDLRLVANSKGDAAAIWSEESTNVASVVRASVYSSTTNQFSNAQKINTQNTAATTPDVSIDANGRALATWLQVEAGTNTLRARPFVNGIWTAEQNFPGLGEIQEARVAARADNVAVLAFVRGGFDAALLVADDFVEGSWVALNNVPGQPGGSASNLRVVLPEQGDATVVLVEAVGLQNPNVRSVRQPISRNADGTLLAFGTIDLGLVEFLDGVIASLPEIAIGADDRVIAVWQQRQGSPGNLSPVRMMSNRLEKGAMNWGTPERIESEGESNSGNAALAASPAGTAIAVWEQFTNGRNDILANIFR